MDSVPITKRQALKMIEGLGFVNPSERFMGRYFIESGLEYKPIVNFETLAIAIEEADLVAQMASVAGLHHTNLTKDAVITSIRNVIKEHRLKGEIL